MHQIWYSRNSAYANYFRFEENNRFFCPFQLLSCIFILFFIFFFFKAPRPPPSLSESAKTFLATLDNSSEEELTLHLQDRMQFSKGAVACMVCIFDRLHTTIDELCTRVQSAGKITIHLVWFSKYKLFITEKKNIPRSFSLITLWTNAKLVHIVLISLWGWQSARDNSYKPHTSRGT